MAFENIQIAHGNFTIDRSGAAFYTMDHGNNQMIKKDSSGNIIFTHFLDTVITEVSSLQFDGFHYWSLERSGTSGFRVRKWEIGVDNLVRVISEFSFISGAVLSYDVYSLAVESYKDTLNGNALVGDTSIDVNGGGTVVAGDRLVLGPSTATGFEGNFSETTVIGKVGNTLQTSPALDNEFSPNDEVYFTRNFFVFSDDGFTGTNIAALFKYNAFTGNLLSVNSSNMFSLVRASTFFKENLFFIRGGEAIWLNPVSQDIFKSQSVDNLNQARSGYINTFDLAGFSDTLFRLEQEHVFLSGGSYNREDWSPQFNYNTSNTLPEVYFVSVKSEPPILHIAVSGLTPTAKITVQVLDQFRTPVFNTQVDLTSDGGALNPIQDNTNANGIVTSTYTANSSEGQVTIDATA